MRLFRSALALSIALSLVLLSPGQSAWAQFAEAAGRGVAPAPGAGSAAAAGAVPLGAAAAPLTASPVLTLGAFAPLSAAPAALIPGAPASLSAAVLPAASLSVPASLPSAVPAPASALSPALRAASLPASAAPEKSAAGPAATALEGARRELPEFSKMSSGDSKGAASADFLARVGESFSRPAPALSAALVPAADGARGESSAPLSRYRASPSNSPAAAPAVESAPVAARAPRSSAAPLFAAAAAAGLSALAGVSLLSTLATLPLVLISLVLHEIGHAKVAAWLGDPTATNEGRASFNPLTWARHVDPMMTLVVPLVTYFTSGFIFGGAKPVPIDSSYFKHPTRDMAKVALAGPAVNVALAALGALAYAGAVAGGLGAAALGVLTSFIFVNALLAVFNLLPILPLDGGHVLLAALPHKAAESVRGFYARVGLLGMVPILAIAVLGGGVIMGAAAALTHLLIGASFALTGVQMASAALPAMAALGLAIGSLKDPGVARLAAASEAPAAPAIPGTASADFERPVDLVVVFSRKQAISKDLHLTSVDSRAAGYVQAYEGVQRSLLAQLNSVGLSPDALSTYNATPVASYARINAATIRVDAAKATEFEAALKALGHKVYPNERRKIITPVPVKPEEMDPSARGAVTMSENLSITKADSVQAAVEKRWGKPDLNPWQRLKLRLGAAAMPQPKVAVVDTGADVTHPLLKRVQEVKNMTSGKNGDGNGHGSWVTSMVLNYAPWLKNLTHYKTFTDDGGASLDDILKSLTAAANDGNLVISNSWGSDEGDPESPDSLLVKKLASEGHVLVFAAGNAGPGANTIGSPAIVQFKDPATGAIRVVAAAATDRDKLVAYFSSRGPGTPKTVGKDGFAHRPDLAAVGLNTEGAWPAALGDADRTDPELGALKAISGTSMSTPSVAGAIALLLLAFGVTEKGAKLDAVINALMATLEKTGKNSVDEEGGGFINVEAAYELLYKQFNPGAVPPTAVLRYRRLIADRKSMQDYLDPLSEANRVAGSPDQRIVNSMLGDLKTTAERMAALEAQYPDIAFQSSGSGARAWARLTGRAPVPAYAAEYRRLTAVVANDEDSDASFLRAIRDQPTGVREEMLERFYQEEKPQSDAHLGALAALLKAHPDAAYQAAGTLGRAWLTLTGRGAKS